MDKDNFVRALMAALLVFVLWTMLFSPRPPPPEPVDPVGVGEVASRPAAPADPADLEIRSASAEMVIDLGNVDDSSRSPYAARVTLSNLGASMSDVHLSDYDAKVNGEQRYALVQPVEEPQRDRLLSLATKKINLDQGTDCYLDDKFWHARREETDDGQRAVFWVEFARPGAQEPFARLTKTYTLARRNPESEEQISDLAVELRYENLSAEPVEIRVTQRGPVGVVKEDPRADDRKIAAGIREEGQISLVSEGFAGLHGQPDLYNDETSAGQFEWAAMGNKFFVVILSAEPLAGHGPWIAQVQARHLLGLTDMPEDAGFELVTTPLTVDAGESLTLPFACYLGPKSKTLFEADPDFARRQYVRLVTDDYYWCAWAPIVNVMLWLLNTCYAIIPNYGLAIIVLVVVVRTLLHPLTKKGQINMTKMATQMAELQPKIEEVRKKYGNDKQKLNQEMMKLYQQQGVNPMGQMLTCLPQMLQMPIWGALWASLNFTVEMRHQGFCLWIHDLTAPDALWDFGRVVVNLPLMGPIDSLNVLPPLLGVGMWLQQRYMPKPASATKRDSKTPDQMAQQRMMMNFMSVFFMLIFYNAPSGLTLYIMASNFFGLFEQFRIRKHIREEQEATQLSPAVRVGQEKRIRKPRFLAKLEKMADDAKKK